MNENSDTPAVHSRRSTQRSESPSFANLPSFSIRVRESFFALKISGPGIVAVSGGADSVALLRALHGFWPFTVAHLNHGLRGNESDADALFVQTLCQDLGLNAITEKITLPSSMPDGVEAAAREARYDFLERVARDAHSGWIATAHTTDDQAETILHRLIRGTGVRGLAGIARVRETQTGVKIIRPMLELTREEVVAYLHEIQQPYRHDSSNDSHDYTRNRIRHSILPLLKEENPSLLRTLQSLATQAGEIHDLEKWSAQQLLGRVPIKEEGDTLIIERGLLLQSPPVVVRLFWRSLWEKMGWATGEMTFEHWERLAQATITGELQATDFPGGIRVKCTPKRMKIRKRESSEPGT